MIKIHSIDNILKHIYWLSYELAFFGILTYFNRKRWLIKFALDLFFIFSTILKTTYQRQEEWILALDLFVSFSTVRNLFFLSFDILIFFYLFNFILLLYWYPINWIFLLWRNKHFIWLQLIIKILSFLLRLNNT
jgi:hypothetical protein